MARRFLVIFLWLYLESVDAANWAVIVAGSQGYENYRHQADACHAYQIVKARGIPEENIIMMAYDDVAKSRENPFKGKLFNKPDPHGPGADVYAGCNIDYSKREVTAKNFISILTGKTENNSIGKVLQSTADDHVFVSFFDHGAPGLIAFPETELHKKQLQSALKTMHKKRMFKKLVFYLESCESGSMFKGMNIPGVYGLSAANAKESSWGTYCSGKSDKVDGKSLQTCLGDLFSVNWMQDVDAETGSQETLEQQFKKVKQKTNKSHVMQWGDLSFLSDTMDSFLGNKTVPFSSKEPLDTLGSAVSARAADLHRLYDIYENVESSSERLASFGAMQVELKRQENAELVYRKIAELAYPGNEDKQKELRRREVSPDFPDCELSAHAAIRTHCAMAFDANSGYALQLHHVVVAICEDIAQGLNFALAAAAEQACMEITESTAIVV